MIRNKFAVGVRGGADRRLVILNRQATSVDGLNREDVIQLISWLFVMSTSLPGSKPITDEEVHVMIAKEILGD